MSQTGNPSLIPFPLFAVPKGGWEASDVNLENAALREAFEEGLTLCSIRLSFS